MESVPESRGYFGCKISQRGHGNAIDFVLFTVNTKDIQDWAGIKRVGTHEHGTQRVLKDSRVRAIRRFLQSNKANTIPISIIVAFEPGTVNFVSVQDNLESCLNTNDISTLNGINDKMEWGIMSFNFEHGLPDHQKPALIVDGQHRLKGMGLLADEDIPIIVVALIDAPPEEQAFQFVVINNKAAKVPTDNVKAIVATFDDEKVRARLAQAGVNYGDMSATLMDINNEPTSPFYQLLIWPLSTEGNGVVQLTAIESCLSYIGRQIGEIKDDDDTEKEVFLAIWRVVKDVYGKLWLHNDRFMSKVNILALNEFIVDRLGYALEGDLIDVYNIESVAQQTRTIISPIPSEFWEQEWQGKLQDNTVTRERIKKDLRTILQNRKGRKWNEGLELIDSAVD